MQLWVYKLLSFMNVYLGYNLILRHPANQEKTDFIIERDIYYYKVMLLRLKNVEAIY